MLRTPQNPGAAQRAALKDAAHHSDGFWPSQEAAGNFQTIEIKRYF
jgi:hypothetical protein